MNEKYRDELRQKAEQISRNQLSINQAQEYDDYMRLIPQFSTFDAANENISIVSYQSLPEEIALWAFQLTLRNMRDIYQNSWKWDEENKKDELLSECARYLVAFKGEDNPVGFIHFRFEQLDYSFISYIYDVQVESSVKETNLRKFLIQAVEMISLRMDVEAVVSFVFKADVEYMQLLQNMQYKYHRTSPAVYRPNEPEKYKHEILYKSLVKDK